MLVARLEVLGEVDARGAIRFHVARESTLRGSDGRPIEVLVDNFSRSGFLFVSDETFPPGTLIAIGLSGAGSREAQVVWQEGTRHGCEFLVPLPQSKMARAFQGQADILANLEAELRKRLPQAEPATLKASEALRPRPETAPARNARKQKLVDAIRQFLED
ncbi:PilZ domain-containing protein [Sphingomonas psychrotolerans]|uniref:PilZ domain-containing protein n=1 Tax=Sphingomonas psychrotolerans TaxID=1327635 RepID=A0ABU3N9B1_9SPHN|nr:PilZ domain-containing protein [Sphingomonas psychrotolerans]MDT8761100.1 PilZ domain-containing protein [Sphingomonas psychrotolerans]